MYKWVNNIYPDQVKEKVKEKGKGKPIEKSTEKVTEKIAFVPNNVRQTEPVKTFDYELTPRKIREAIVWSEILGEPVCKRRKRR
ncbi:MAG: hypothetical protein ACYDEX_03005 [Mobilitalea sp.]